MKQFNVNVLGTPYKCLVGGRAELMNLDRDFQGLCKVYSKEIWICDEIEDFEDFGESRSHIKSKAIEEVLTHELAHAFLFESGLSDYSNDEILVQWIAINIKKLNSGVLEMMKKLNLTSEGESDTIR